MLALLRANPDAFIKGNINLVKAGAVLRIPDGSELSEYSAREARAIVHEQIGQWREMRRAAEQPAAVAAQDATGGEDASPAAGTPSTADARLEIVPPSGDDARQAGTRSGIQAGGEGDMLQELQQTKETLAARDAEVQELKARVAELEKLQQDQQQLIALKDNKLAETQQALAARQAVADTPAAQQSMAIWPWAIGALLVVAALAWLLVRRRAAAPSRPAFDTSRLAASVPSPASRQAAPAAAEPAAAPAGRAPTWHAGGPPPTQGAAAVAPSVEAPVETPVEAPEPVALSEPASEPEPEPRPGIIEASEASPLGHDRVELARAYIELGDVDTARGLLQEVADEGDPAARGEALRLLRELV